MVGKLESLEAELELLWQAGCEGVWQDGDEVVAYFPDRQALPVAGAWAPADDEDYLARYYADLKPVYLKTLVVAPTHTEVGLSAGQKPLWLDPGMAFGSGHHETTYLALQALEALTLRDKDVLDIGAGSGILALAADLLGCRSAEGIDIDEATLSVAEENARLNRSRAVFEHATLANVAAESADVIIANLYAELHQQLEPDYTRVLRSEGELIVTGILEAKLPGVVAVLETSFTLLETRTKNEWALVWARCKGQV